MAKSSKTTSLPPKGVLELLGTGELVIRTADQGDFLLTEIAKAGADGCNAELHLVVELSKRSLGDSDARAGIRAIAQKLEDFLGKRALDAIVAEATCRNVPSVPKAPPAPPAPPAKPAKSPKKPKDPKAAKR